MATNITMLLPPATVDAPSFGTMAAFASTLLWGSLELVISLGVIIAYSHVLSYATGLVLRDEQSLEHSNDPDLPKKEQTAALMLSGFLGGIHLMMVFLGLPLLGYGDDSFLMKNLLSCAILAAVTTGFVVGGIILYLIVPAFVACGSSVSRRVRGTPKATDVEAASETKKALLETIYEKAEEIE